MSLTPPPSVYFYNYGWLDYGVPTLESILDMVKVVDFALRGGKVAIHCHAGLGRTGVLIACYLVYSQRMSGDEAITLVRSNRCVVVRRLVVAVHTPSPLHIHHHHLSHSLLPPYTCTLLFLLTISACLMVLVLLVYQHFPPSHLHATPPPHPHTLPLLLFS